MLRSFLKLDSLIILRNFFTGLFFSILSRVVSFLATIIIIRELSVNDYGLFKWLSTILSYGLLVVSMGFPIYFQTLLSSGIYSLDKLVFVQLFYRLSISAFFAIFLSVLMFVLNEDVYKLAFLLFLQMFAYVMDFNWLLNYNNKSYLNNLGEFVQSSFILLSTLILYINGSINLYTVTVIFTLAVFLNSASKLYFSRDLGVQLLFKKIFLEIRLYILWSMDEIIRILKRSFIVNLSMIMITVYYNLDSLMLGIFRSNEEVAKYTVAYNYLLLSIIPTNILYQSFQRYLLVNRTSKNAYMNYTVSTTILGIIIFLLLIFFHEALILIPFGEKYKDSVNILFWLCFDIIPCYLAGALANPINLFGYHKEYLFIVGSGALFNAVGNFVLIPIYGIYGAVATTICSEIIVAILAGIFLYYRSKIWEG